MPEQPPRSRARVNLTLSKTAMRLLEASSKALGISKSAVADQAIRHFWTRHASKVAQALKVKPR